MMTGGGSGMTLPNTPEVDIRMNEMLSSRKGYSWGLFLTGFRVAASMIGNTLGSSKKPVINYNFALCSPPMINGLFITGS